ncbi:MAG: MATE family efflux transporter [Bacillota bacterium]
MKDYCQDLTQGNVTKQLIKFALPFILSNFIQALYSITDMLIMGWVQGSAGISAVGMGAQVALIVTNGIIGLTVGGTVLIAQYMGAKRREDVSETVSTVITFSLFAGLCVTAVMLLLNGPLLRLINAPEESFAMAKSYTDVCMGGAVFIFLYNGISAVMRGMGDSKRPVYFVAIAAVINAILCALFVAVFDMGAAGSALATVIAQMLSVVIACVYLGRNGFVFDFKLKSFRLFSDKLRGMIRIGLPNAVQQMLVSVSFLLLLGVINVFGIHASAAANVASKISAFAIMPTLAISSAIASMAGQNIGAGLYERAYDTMKHGVRMAVIIAIAVTLLAELFPAQLISIFTSDPEDIRVGVEYFRFYCMDWLFVAFLINMNGLVIGAGHTLFTMLNSLLSSVLLRVPLAYLFGIAMGKGISGIGLANGISPILPLCIAFWYIRTNRWKSEKGKRIIIVE